jgi:filamentous hemagglutinin
MRRSARGNSTTVTIQQTQSQALLTWSSFNVGVNTIVDFNQQPGWLAINKINDPSGVPSQILGQINAPGQVYLINRNGIIFGGTSQVNVGTLVASALPINDALVQAGSLYGNLDAQFTFSSYSQPGGTLGPTNAFNPDAATIATQDSKVVVQAGAVIQTPLSPTNNGGRVILIGPEVSNAGTIRTPDGQTILAAGQQVALFPHASSDPSLRGLDVYVGSVLAPVTGIDAPN